MKLVFGSLVKYENGEYILVEGTSLFDLYPEQMIEYCEDNGTYFTQNGAYTTWDEAYESLQNKGDIETEKSTSILNSIKTFFENIFNKFRNIFE